MQNIYIKTYFPKQRSVAVTVAMGLVLTLVYLLSDSTEASGATVSASGGSCTQTVGSSTGVSVAVVNGKCVVTFANVGTTTWTVPAGVGSVRTLVVGGGGGAGGGGCNWMYGRGGGGGAVVDTASTVVTAGATLNIIVGAGGVAAVSRTVGGVINSCADGLPYSVGSTGGQGGSSQFGTATAVIGGYSSPATTSAGGTSGNGNIGSGSAGAANTLNSWSGGGGGGAGGPGTQSGSGSNWQCGGLLFGNGGPGLFSDITGTSIGHGGGAAGSGCSGNGSATSGGEYYLSGYFRSVGSYGGGGMNTTGGAGVVIISYATIVSAGAPTIGVATSTGGTTATVAFTAPASDGGATITSYTATSSPAGGTGTLSQAGSGTISVTGLSGGVDYTFTVTATNSVGTSSPSAASNSITTSQPTASSGQLPTVLTVDPQSSSRYLPTTLNTVGPTNLLLCLNESDGSGNNLASPTINFDVAANGATTAGTGTSTISGDRTTATYIYGVTADVITTLNSVLGSQIYLSSGAFSATKYIKIRAISIASSSSIGSKTCASTVYTSQNIEIRPLVLQRTMKKGTITLKG